MQDRTVIAHISDLHVTPLAGMMPRDLNIKRTLGLLNYHRSRKSVHRSDVADRLVADMLSTRPDHIAVTGDLCNIGLPGEYAAALSWLERIGPPDAVTVVPGNHDIYTRLGHHPGVELWRAYMQSDSQGAALRGSGAAERGFPIVRHVGCAALVGLNSAIETRPFVAAGRLGMRQLEALAQLLRALRQQALARIVLIHHPPLVGQAPARRGLSDAAALAEVLRDEGAELILHGHDHRDSLHWAEGMMARIPVIGIASGSAGRRHKGEPLARYNLITVRRTDDGWSVEVNGRGLASPDGGVVDIERHVLTPPMPSA